jgi:xanthine dehydrogenase YagT iron-sulfur-binding subunit
MQCLIFFGKNGAGTRNHLNDGASDSDAAKRHKAMIPADSKEPEMPESGFTRRCALKRGLILGGSLIVGSAKGLAQASDQLEPSSPPPAAKLLTVSFTLNGQPAHVQLEARTTLLDLLREGLDHPGTKKGCDHGQCGACTVLVSGRRVLSCLTLAATVEGKQVTTVEGLAENGNLHPLQAAFVKHDAFQCGFCTPGQLVSAVGFLKEQWPMTPDGIREGMSGNICRCGAYCGIVAAISEVRSKQGASPS